MGGIKLTSSLHPISNKFYDMKVTGSAGSGSNNKNPYLLGSNFITYYFDVNIIAAGFFEISKAPEDTNTLILSCSCFVMNQTLNDVIVSNLGTKYRVTIGAFVSSKKCYITLTTRR